jgi:hypothetical protein
VNGRDLLDTRSLVAPVVHDVEEPAGGGAEDQVLSGDMRQRVPAATTCAVYQRHSTYPMHVRFCTMIHVVHTSHFTAPIIADFGSFSYSHVSSLLPTKN